MWGDLIRGCRGGWQGCLLVALWAPPVITSSSEGRGAVSVKCDRGAAWPLTTLLLWGAGGPYTRLLASLAGCSVLLTVVPGLGWTGREGGASSSM